MTTSVSCMAHELRRLLDEAIFADHSHQQAVKFPDRFADADQVTRMRSNASKSAHYAARSVAIALFETCRSAGLRLAGHPELDHAEPDALLRWLESSGLEHGSRG